MARKTASKKKVDESKIDDLSMATTKGALTVINQDEDPKRHAKVVARAKKIDINSTTSIIGFAVDKQTDLTEKSKNLMNGVLNKDTGPVGEIMNGLMVQIRGLGVDSLDPNAKQSFLGKVFGKMTPVAKFIQSYESIEHQIDAMVVKLENEKRILQRDVMMLDDIYNDALDFFESLAIDIEAGELRLKEANETEIPQLAKRAEETNDMLDAQKLRDMKEHVLDLERRVQDLRLTRQVTMQMLPQIRMIQDVDKGLVTKIQSSVLTAIPVWTTQIALAITLWRQTQAIKVQKNVADATNEMLKQNSAMLKQNNASARKEIERGVVDMETIKQVNADLIATINESISIAEDGQKARLASQVDLLRYEGELKTALRNAKNGQKTPVVELEAK